MFNRRKARTGHSPAYTGVNHVAAASSQPNSNALAAALTIGKTDNVQKQVQTNSSDGGLSRRASVQMRQDRPVSQEGRGSLLHRNSIASHRRNGSADNASFADFSEASIRSKGGAKVPFTPPQSRQQRGFSNGDTISVDIDDSYNDSYMEAINNETDKTYDSNRMSMKDLKLSHRPLSPPPSNRLRNSGSRGSFRGSFRGNEPEVKMIKKYIPTPTGIKIVEVPESTFKKEIARNNSIRSGLNVSRIGSMGSVSRKPSLKGINNQIQGPRKQSLNKKPSMTPMKEDVEREQSISSSHSQAQLDSLQMKIEEEKKMTRDLERKRKEYEEAKRKRMLEEKRLTMMQEDDTSEEDVPLPDIPIKVDELDQAISHDSTSSPLGKGKKPLDEGVSTARDSQSESSPEYDNISNGIAESIDPSKLLVDELEQKEKVVSELSHDDDVVNTTVEKVVTVPTTARLEQPSTAPTEEVVDGHVGSSSDEAVDVDDLNDAEFNSESMAKHLRPTFDTVPEIIKDDVSESSSDKLPVPSVIASHDGSSISSTNSGASINGGTFSKSRPVKSAMKNRNSANTKKDANDTISSPAHEAYLSLATAENTRLNSKLSSSKLNEGGNGSPLPSNRNSFINQQQKNHIVTLRKPNVQQNNLSMRTLRPQSMQDVNQLKGQQDVSSPSNGGMGFRTLRDTPTNHFNSPSVYNNTRTDDQDSKMRAAALYAKASARPVSVFKPLKRSSSFNRSQPQPGEETIRQDNIPKGRTSLRDHLTYNTMPPATSHAPHDYRPQSHLPTSQPVSSQPVSSQPVSSQPVSSRQGVPRKIISQPISRLNDSSDDEKNIEKDKTSRYDDSDDGLDLPVLNSQEGIGASDSIERKSGDMEKKNQSTKHSDNPKEKKKFKKLRRIFGK